jgi:hypothetical protein
LLGDPSFPDLGFKGSHGERIRWCQELYAQYSRLAFTNDPDRSIAIRGLEARLMKGFGCLGGHGVFDDGDGGLLAWSLLWRRPDNQNSLARIEFPQGVNAPPSWSWMAYKGAIDYLKMEEDKVDWETDELRSPWNRRAGTKNKEDYTYGAESYLTAEARNFNTNSTSRPESVVVVYDDKSMSHNPAFKCVVLGRERDKGKPLEDKIHCVLVVQPHGEEYERVGVGFLPGRCIGRESQTVRVV